MSRHYSLRSLDALQREVVERDNALSLLLGKILVQQQQILAQQAEIFAALNLAPSAAAVAPIVVLSEVREELLERAA